MTANRNAPAVQGTQGAMCFSSEYYKDTQISAKVQRKVYKLFLTGRKYTVADITYRLGVCDPRGHIRDLRKKGVHILDEWKASKFGNRCKLYYLKREV